MGAILALWIAPLFAIEVVGSIADKETKLPIGAAIVSIDSRSAVTDYAGRFVFENFAPGEYDLLITHIAYESLAKHIIVRDGENMSLSIELDSRVYISDEVYSYAQKTENILSVNTADGVIEYLKTLPGVSVIQGNGDVALSIRGSRPEDVLVVIDGIIQAKNESGWTDIRSLPITEINSIKVLTSSIPVEYSSFAPAGVLVIETFINESNEARLTFRDASFSSSSITAGMSFRPVNYLSLSMQNSWSFKAMSFPYAISDSIKNRSNNWSRNRNLAFDMNYNRNIGKGALSFNYNFLEEGMPGDTDHPTPTAYRTGRGVEAFLSLSAYVTSKIELESKFKASQGKRFYYIPRPFVYVPVEAEHVIDNYSTQLGFIREDGRFTSSIAGKFLEESYMLENHLASTRSIPREPRQIYSSWIEGRYFCEFFKTSRISVFNSLRWDKICDIKTRRSYSAEASISKDIFGFVIAGSAGYSEAMHLPEFVDLYWLRDAFAEGNPELSPEIAYNRHLKFSLGRDLSWMEFDLDIDLFSRTIDSVIVWKRDFDGIYRPCNFAREETRGREDRFKAVFLDAIEVSYSNTSLNSIHRSHDQVIDSMWIPFRAPYDQKINISAQIKGFSAGISGQMIGERYTLIANTKTTKPYELWGVFFEISQPIDFLQTTFRLDWFNILDEDYEVLTNYPMPGRNWAFSINIEYII